MTKYEEDLFYDTLHNDLELIDRKNPNNDYLEIDVYSNYYELYNKNINLHFNKEISVNKLVKLVNVIKQIHKVEDIKMKTYYDYGNFYISLNW